MFGRCPACRRRFIWWLRRDPVACSDDCLKRYEAAVFQGGEVLRELLTGDRMTKDEFVKTWAQLVGESRKAQYPDIRPSEAAFATLDDMAYAAKQWRKWKHFLTGMTPDEFSRRCGPDPHKGLSLVKGGDRG